MSELITALRKVTAAIRPINNLALVVTVDESDFKVVFLYDPKKPEDENFIGGADIEYDSGNTVWSVSGIYAEKGWGPTLYLALMQISEPDGLTSSPGGDDGNTREDAINVWENFYDGVGQTYVTKEKLENDRGNEGALTYKYHPAKKVSLEPAIRNHIEYEKNHPDIAESLQDQASEKWQNI